MRILDILKSTDEQHPVTAAGIIEKLKQYSIEPERKSVLRDIGTLTDYGYDIVLCSDNKKGYFMASRDFEDWELKVLMDAVQSARFLSKSDSDALIDKLCAQASTDSQRTLRLMTIPAEGKSGSRSTKLAIDTVLRAMRSHNKVSFDYLYTDESLQIVSKHPDDTRPVSPYALVWRGDRYYLIGCYDGSEVLSYYRLDRIHGMEILDDRALPLRSVLGTDAETALREFVRKNIYNFKGETVGVRLKVTSGGVDTIKDSFGAETSVHKNPDGTLTAMINVSDSEGLYLWLMRHAKDVVVLEPEHIRAEMRRRLEEMLEQYRKED